MGADYYEVNVNVDGTVKRIVCILVFGYGTKLSSVDGSGFSCFACNTLSVGF